jgi:hypothetical protein
MIVKSTAFNHLPHKKLMKVCTAPSHQFLGCRLCLTPDFLNTAGEEQLLAI